MLKEDKEPFLLFYNVLGFAPKNLSYYKMAVTHRSAAIKSQNGKYLNNERLELLGDSVLNTVISDMLYHQYANQNEGFLSNARSKLVSRDTLNRIAVEIGLDKLIITSKRNNIQKSNIYGNAFEALMGAIYLDQGYAQCRKFIENRIYKSHLEVEKLIRKEVNFKSKLLEVTQKNKIETEFISLQERKIDKQKMFFESEIVMNKIPVATGSGSSRKESQQKASQFALEKLSKNKEILQDIISSKVVEDEVQDTEPETIS
jgi:ribonuclease-3